MHLFMEQSHLIHVVMTPLELSSPDTLSDSSIKQMCVLSFHTEKTLTFTDIVGA